MSITGGLYAELAMATELGYDGGFLQKQKLQVFIGLSVSQTNFNYIFQNQMSGFADLSVGCRRKLSIGALELWVSAGEPFLSPAKRYGLGLSYVLP